MKGLERRASGPRFHKCSDPVALKQSKRQSSGKSDLVVSMPYSQVPGSCTFATRGTGRSTVMVERWDSNSAAADEEGEQDGRGRGGSGAAGYPAIRVRRGGQGLARSGQGQAATHGGPTSCHSLSPNESPEAPPERVRGRKEAARTPVRTWHLVEGTLCEPGATGALEVASEQI